MSSSSRTEVIAGYNHYFAIGKSGTGENLFRARRT